MKIAQEIRAGNVIMQGKDPMVVLKTEYSRGGRNAATVRMKLKNLLNESAAPNWCSRPTTRWSRSCWTRRSAPTPTSPTRCMPSWTPSTTSSRSNPRTWATPSSYLEDAMPVEVVFYDGKAISVELPTPLVREITYTEPAVKGDTSGKVLKPAKLATGFEISRAAVRRQRRQDRDRHPHARVPQARLIRRGRDAPRPPRLPGGLAGTALDNTAGRR